MESVDELLSEADIAMYQAKASGKACCQVPGLNATVRRPAVTRTSGPVAMESV